METTNFSTKTNGIASDSDLASVNPMSSSLEGTTWNYTMDYNIGNVTSGTWSFKTNGVCIIQQLKPQAIWWPVTWTENGNHFIMIDKGAGGSYGTYAGSHYNGKGSGSYVVTPPDSSQDASFTITKD